MEFGDKARNFLKVTVLGLLILTGCGESGTPTPTATPTRVGARPAAATATPDIIHQLLDIGKQLNDNARDHYKTTTP